MSENATIKVMKEGHQADYFSKLHAEAIKLEFTLTSEQHSVIEELYAPLHFIPGTSDNTDHPVGAAHQRFAELQLNNFAKNHKPIIDIKPNLVGHLKIAEGNPYTVHACSKFDAREQCRHATSAQAITIRKSTDVDYCQSVQKVASGESTDRICLNEFKNCDVQASYAIANHSLYDIPLRDIAIGFHKHGTVKLVAYMHLLPQALHVEEHTDKQLGINFTVYTKGRLCEKKKYIRFGFIGDYSFAYEHEYETWMAYLTCGGFSTPFGFGLTVEKVRHHGSNFKIIIKRADVSGHFAYMIPSGMHNFIGVPNMRLIASTGFHDNAKPTYIIADRGKVTRLYMYLIARDPNERTLRIALAYARSEVRRIQLGDNVIETSWDIDAQQFEDLVLSVYIMSLISCARMDLITRMSVKQISEALEGNSWYERLFPRSGFFGRWIYRLFGTKREPAVERILNSKVSWRIIARLQLNFYATTLSESTFRADGYITQIFNPPIRNNSTQQVFEIQGVEDDADDESSNNDSASTVADSTIAESITTAEELANCIKDANPEDLQVLINAMESIGYEVKKKPTVNQPEYIIEGLTKCRQPLYATGPVRPSARLPPAQGQPAAPLPVITPLRTAAAQAVQPPFVNQTNLPSAVITTAPIVNIDPPATGTNICRFCGLYGYNDPCGMCNWKLHDKNNRVLYYGAAPRPSGFQSKKSTPVVNNILEAAANLPLPDSSDDEMFDMSDDSRPMTPTFGLGARTSTPIKQPAVVVAPPVAPVVPVLPPPVIVAPNITTPVVSNAQPNNSRYKIPHDESIFPKHWLFGKKIPEQDDNKPRFNVKFTTSDLSNMAKRNIDVEIKGTFVSFNSVEHAYQYIKCIYMLDVKTAFAIRMAEDPFEAKRLAKNAFTSKQLLESGWITLQIHVMLNLLRERAKQDPSFIAMLDTKVHYIHNVVDKFWGHPGANYFGRLLAVIAEENKPRLLGGAIDSVAVEHERFLVELTKNISTVGVGNGLRDLLENLRKELAEYDVGIKKSNTINVIMGVPGSGKTTYVLNNDRKDKGDEVLFIVPTRALKNEYDEKITGKDKVMTLHSALLALLRGTIAPSHIYVDEAFMFPWIYIVYCSHFSNTTILGDPNQIGHIDFSESWGTCSPVVQNIKGLPCKTLTKSYRVPHDILQLKTIKESYPTMTTVSKQRNSITYVEPGFIPKCKHQVLVLTQSVKSHYKKEGAITVHEAQGGTYENVLLHIGSTPGEQKLLKSSAHHIIVGLTRHTNQIFIREQTPGLLINAMQSAKLDTLIDWSDVPMPDFNNTEERTFQVAVDQAIERDTQYVPVKADFVMAQDLLASILPSEGEVCEYQYVLKNKIPFKKGAKGTVYPDVLHEDMKSDTKKHVTHRFPVGQRLRYSCGSSKMQGLQTLLDRYTKITKNLPKDKAEKEAKHLVAKLSEYVDFKDINRDALLEVWAEAIEKYQLRGHDITDIEDIMFPGDKQTDLVKYMLKHQQKVDMTEQPMTRDKAGQGIAAWSKTINMVLVIWTRLLERILMSNAKKSFHFICKYDDEQVQALLDKLATENKNSVYFEGDYTEWDSSLNNVEHMFFCELLKKIGCPLPLRELFYAMMTKRMVVCPYATIRVENKKDSGRVDTLIGNTAYNAAVTLSCIDSRDVLHALFKGDDSLIIGRYGLRLNLSRIAEFEDKHGLKLRPTMSKTAEFVSFIMTPAGSCLNIPRLASKVLTRGYVNEEDMDNYREAVTAQLRLNGTGHASRICKANALHHKCSQEQIDGLLSFLINFSKKSMFKDTCVFEKRAHYQA